MRRSLVWALGASIVLSIAALWTTEAPRVVAAVAPQLREHAVSLDLPLASSTVVQTTAQMPLPAELPTLVLETARRDIFAPDLPPPPKVVPLPVPVAAPAPPPPPPPQAPPLTLRYLGSMRTPEGRQLVYLTRGDNAILVAVGDKLDEGYIVESIATDSVVLVYPQLDRRVTVPIPKAPEQ
jgi:hypothetical protein